MGLLGMMARTAVVAGTATAVSNRVSRRQAGKWNQQAEARAYEEQQAPPREQQDQQAPPQYQQAPAQYQQAPAQYQQAPAQYQQEPPAPAAAPAAAPNLVDEIQRLATLKDQGILSEAEFAAAKRKLLGI